MHAGERPEDARAREALKPEEREAQATTENFDWKALMGALEGRLGCSLDWLPSNRLDSSITPMMERLPSWIWWMTLSATLGCKR